MSSKPTLVSVSNQAELSGIEKDRIVKLRNVLEVLTPRGGPSIQAVKTALYDGSAEIIAATILRHTEEGVEGERMLEAILALEPTGRLARFLAAELKQRANLIQAHTTEGG